MLSSDVILNFSVPPNVNDILTHILTRHLKFQWDNKDESNAEMDTMTLLWSQ